MRRYIAALSLSLVILAVSGYISVRQFESGLHATSSPTPTPGVVDDKVDRATSDPYTGDLARFDREKRAENLQIERVMDILGISEGKQAADIGAGGGWFSVIAAKRVGATGKVFAVDINRESKAFIDRRSEAAGLKNIVTIISEIDDPLLPENSVDAVLILNTYHEFSEPIKLLRNLKKALRKDALVGIIDRNGSGGDHGIDFKKVIDEAERAGFTFLERHDFVSDGKMDYFLVLKSAQSGNNTSQTLKVIS